MPDHHSTKHVIDFVQIFAEEIERFGIEGHLYEILTLGIYEYGLEFFVSGISENSFIHIADKSCNLLVLTIFIEKEDSNLMVAKSWINWCESFLDDVKFGVSRLIVRVPNRCENVEGCGQ